MQRSTKPDALHSFLDAITEGDASEIALKERVLGRGRTIAGRYKLRDRIARGGMATIWEAEDETLGRVVAIKFMGRAYVADADYRKRFEEEAKAAARLQTPFVAQTYDHGATDDGVPFIVMERLQGEDLQARLDRVSTLPLAEVAKLASEGGRALKVAHAGGIIHRDLKPKNLFLAREEEAEIWKLLDFGVAKHEGTASVMTATGVMLGSPYYMSPEQVLGCRDLDVRTDLWSFAATLYRALTGVKPFDGEVASVMRRIATEPVPPPSSIQPDVPPSFDDFFAKALATDRNARFQTAIDLLDGFHAAMSKRGATSGVRAISRTPGDHDDAPRDRYSPSDRPTISAPLSMFERLDAENEESAPSTGLRFGESRPSLPSDRPTQPNPWIQSTSLTSEQEHGFSDPEAADHAVSRWHRADETGPMPLVRATDPRALSYAAIGSLVVLVVIGATFLLAWALR
jgi:serine/threonine protein kinase